MSFNYRYLFALIPLALVLGLMYYFSDIVSYVILAWVLSMIGAPAYAFFRKFFGKNTSAVSTLGMFILLAGLLIYVFIPPLVQQARNLASIDYNQVINSLEEPISDWENVLESYGLLDPKVQADTLNNIAEHNHDHHKDEFVKAELIKIDSSFFKQYQDSAKAAPFAILVNIDNAHLKSPEVKESPEEPKSFFDEAKENIVNFINPAQIQNIFGSIIGFFGNMMIALMSILFIAFFFIREQGLFSNMISSVVPNAYEDRTIGAIDETSQMLIRYFIGIATQVTVITVLVATALGLLGIKNALLIGFFAALMNVIPYLGPIIGATFAIIITVSSNLDMSFYSELLPILLKVLAVFGGMQLLDNFILQPTIFGRSVKAHPLEIFIVVLMGAKLGGVLGMVLAIPAYTVIRVVAKVFLSEFKVVQRITKSLDQA